MYRPMTTEELFNRIQDILKEKDKLPAILDYGLAIHRPVPIKTYEFDLINKLSHGGSEGIYLELWIGLSILSTAAGKRENSVHLRHCTKIIMQCMSWLDFWLILLLRNAPMSMRTLMISHGRAWMSMRLMKMENAVAGDIHAVTWRRRCPGKMSC